jgi:hemerythrin-like domain-containing protein
MKNNKLIAEFMGVNPTILGDEITYEMYGVIDCIEDGVDEQHFFLEEQLLFHTSWDWLMPVIKKMADIRKDTHYRLYNTIDDAYNEVVEFIKSYNKGEIK